MENCQGSKLSEDENLLDTHHYIKIKQFRDEILMASFGVLGTLFGIALITLSLVYR